MATYQGTRHHSAKMTPAKVRQARKSYDTGKWTIARLAEKYGLSWPAMNAIIQRESWKHIS